MRSCDKRSNPGGRRENEDYVNYALAGGNLIAVLADGLGGQGDGQIASQTVGDSLLTCGADGAFPSHETIRRAFDEANRLLMSKQKNSFHMKTTAVYFCQQGNRAVWAHIGDSRLYHIYQDRVEHYTLDHSAAQLSVFMGDITREQIPKDPARNRLIRAMGIAEAEPDIHEAITLAPGAHAFLLCSDGLWEYLTDAEIIDVCRREKRAGRCLDVLLKYKTPKSPADCDNYSAFLLLLEV